MRNAYDTDTNTPELDGVWQGLRSTGFWQGKWSKTCVSWYCFAEMVKNQFWGWMFITLGSVSFLGFVYSAILSKFLPPSTNPVVSALQNDWYYCFLVPVTLPVLVVAVYFHWLSMKLFKHA